MITFPPSLLPTDPDEHIEPIIQIEKQAATLSKCRGDTLLFSEGMKALAGQLFITDNGKFIQIVDSARWFEWDGRSRRILSIYQGNSREALLETLKEAWLFDRTRNEQLYAEAQMHFGKAVAYDPKQDIQLIIKNLDLLIENTDRILSTSYMLNGALGALRVGFVYCGQRRFPISALLGAWKEDLWMIPCDNDSSKLVHNAYVLTAIGGLSIGSVEVYCRECRVQRKQNDSGAKYYASMKSFIPERCDGYRVDEIIDELHGETHL